MRFVEIEFWRFLSKYQCWRKRGAEVGWVSFYLKWGKVPIEYCAGMFRRSSERYSKKFRKVIIPNELGSVMSVFFGGGGGWWGH